MSQRRRYLVTYDIADDRRRASVFTLCRQQGDHTQYSVFVAELDDRELIAFQAELASMIHHSEDQVLFADLGPAEREAGRIIASLGRPYEPPIRALVV
jgi:CRISPR-associated protein Cas2